MPSRLIQIEANDLICPEQESEEGEVRYCIVHLSERVLHEVLVTELEEDVRFAIQDVRRIREEIKNDPSNDGNKCLMGDLEDAMKLIKHANYLARYYGGKEQHLPEDIIEQVSAAAANTLQ